jgi:pimeloyl-ACP methyl ester carboxylesterase
MGSSNVNVRRFGEVPYKIVVVHGGPGAPGGMAPVAEELGKTRGVLEPLQTAASISGQVQELRAVLDEHGDIPVTLIGWSWGAWLCFITASRHPGVVTKLILVGSGPFEEKYARGIAGTRLSRLRPKDRSEFEALAKALGRLEGRPAHHRDSKSTPAALARLGELTRMTDSYDPLPILPPGGKVDIDVYRSVWAEAQELRRSGGLLGLAGGIRCPVIAIHGDYDPHPYEGVKIPLAKVLPDFRFFLLKKCGHYPWTEREARDRFFQLLREVL